MERLTAPSGYKGLQPTVRPELVGKLSRCGHIYHIYCLVAMYNNGNKVSPGPWGTCHLRCWAPLGLRPGDRLFSAASGLHKMITCLRQLLPVSTRGVTV